MNAPDQNKSLIFDSGLILKNTLQEKWSTSTVSAVIIFFHYATVLALNPPQNRLRGKEDGVEVGEGEKEKGQMSGRSRKRIAKRCEHFSKMMFCASNILLTAAGSDPSIMCEYISSPGPPSPQAYKHTHARTHINTHAWTHFLVTEAHSPPPIPLPPFFFFFFYRSKLSKLCLKVNEGWLALSLPFSRSLSPSRFDISVFFFFSLLATVSGLGDNCR